MQIGLRTRLLLPIGAIALAIAAYALVSGGPDQPKAGWIVGALLLLAAVLATNVEVLVLRPLQKLLRSAQELAQGQFGGGPLNAPSGPMRALAADLNRLRERMQQYEVKLADERAGRQTLEQSVRELKDRYALTVERANDGIWEWNLESGVVDFSVRWKAMLGWSEAPMPGIDDWRALLHPDDRAGVLLSLESYFKGQMPRFDEQYRLRHGDGHYRWVHSRGTAIRHASGAAYRLIVMDNDIHARKEIETALIAAAEGLSNVSGTDFFQALMRHLSQILGTRDNLVCYFVGDPPTKARTLAYYTKGEFTENFDYDLAGTSCAAVFERGEIVYCPTGVCELWPEEKQYDRDSYIGVPMFDSKGKIIGHFACMNDTAMRQDLPHLALFRIFAVRAAAELERTLLRKRLDSSDGAAKIA